VSPKAAGRLRGVVVAIGVPLVFVLMATLLTFGGASAGATEPGWAAAPEAPAGTWAVRRQLVRPLGAPMHISYRMHTTAPVVFITVDDGVHKDPRALRYVERTQLPVTAFLSTWTIKTSADFFRGITQWGSIQNHSSTHASLANSTTDLNHEICVAQETLTRDFGTQPWLLRPPYGVGADRMEVQVTARRCGVSRIVMWNAVVDKGKLIVPGGHLRAGDIVLLHFNRHLARDLRVAVAAADRDGLTPASLASYWPQGVS